MGSWTDPGATKVFTERTPDTPPFTTAIPQVNAQTDGSPLQQGTEKKCYWWTI